MTELISNLEFTFGFRDPAFSSYVTRMDLHTMSPSRLIELTSDMSGHPHPLVRYAAGWAAVEAGMIPPWHAARYGEWTPRHREEAIDIGNTIWRTIEDDEWTAPTFSTIDDNLQAELWAFNLRRHVGMAYLPAFRLVARCRVGETLTARDAYGQFSKTKWGLKPTIHTILTERNERPIRHRHISGLAGELATAWLLQPEFLQLAPPAEDAPGPKYIVAPASIRQDHHPRHSYRSDLNAYIASLQWRKKPIQVGTDYKNTQTKVFQVVVERDLKCYARTQQDLIRRIHLFETGNFDSRPFLLGLSNKLHTRFMAYVQEYAPRT